MKRHRTRNPSEPAPLLRPHTTPSPTPIKAKFYHTRTPFSLASIHIADTFILMIVEKLKYTIWAADPSRATIFYQNTFAAKITNQNPHITELQIAGGLIAIHGGGQGKQTWTGITFQVPNVVTGAAEIVTNGGKCEKEPQPEDGEPPHLAMCEDTEGNQIMLSRARS